MNKPRVRGGITVAGLVTGSYLIEDIKISVPHQVAVYIPAELAFNSKDLWRGISQRRLFQLTGGSGLAVEPAPPKSEVSEDTGILVAENKSLRKELGEVRRQNSGLQGALQAMQGQLASILQVLGKLEDNVVVSRLAAPVSEAIKSSEVVGGDIPEFIPEEIKPDKVESQVSVKTEVGGSVEDAAKALRKARSKK